MTRELSHQQKRGDDELGEHALGAPDAVRHPVECRGEAGEVEHPKQPQALAHDQANARSIARREPSDEPVRE